MHLTMAAGASFDNLRLSFSAVGWDSLTPHGIRFGIATILALMAWRPAGHQPSRSLEA
jgi:hypothetical protein